MGSREGGLAAAKTLKQNTAIRSTLISVEKAEASDRWEKVSTIQQFATARSFKTRIN